MSFTKYILLPVTLILLCTEGQGIPEQKSQSLQQLTFEGQNRQPLLNGEQGFYFISRSRKGHKDSQVYYYDFTTQKAKQVTHQRGHIIGGAVSKGGDYFYSSSTDEEKETPDLLKEYISNFPAEVDPGFFAHLNFKKSEIYKIDGKTSDVQRISNRPGFDAFPIFSSKKNKYFFSRFVKDRIALVQKRKRTPTSQRPIFKSTGHDLGMQMSPNEQLFAWYRFSPDFRSSQLMLAGSDLKAPKLLTTDEGIQWTPQWHPNGKTIVYSARKKNDKNFNLYEIELSTGCQRKISSLAGDEFFPILDPKGERVFFTATLTGSEQIHTMPYPSPFRCDSDKVK